jgi:hypothetical protein
LNAFTGGISERIISRNEEAASDDKASVDRIPMTTGYEHRRR